MQRPDAAGFRARGWMGPVRLLTGGETRAITAHLRGSQRPPGMDWSKGLAATDSVIFDLAADARIRSLLVPLIGDSFFIWGAMFVERAPGESHPWHTDIETAASDGRAASVWIALENASRDSTLGFICGSHLYGKSLQQVASERGLDRHRRTAEASLELAQSLAGDATLARPEVTDGDALVFDGRVWHGSLNSRQSGVRRALVLQYATPDLEIRHPDWSQLDWPFRFRSSPKPPVVMVSGKPAGRLNRVVAPPLARAGTAPPLQNLATAIPRPLPRNPRKGWRPHPLFRGSTPILRNLSCHASILEPGCSPHPPHSHFDEEILVILEGEADIVIASAEDDPAPRIERMQAGDMVYYPSYQFHTIRCAGESPVSYFMYRWGASVRPNEQPLALTVCKGLKTHEIARDKPFATSTVLEGPTGLLDKLQVHLSRAAPGGGYAEHRDRHDVAMLLFEGAVNTLDARVEAPAVILYPAMSPHGLQGIGDSAARYLVVEFHGPHTEPPTLLESARWKMNWAGGRFKAALRRLLKLLGLRRATN